MLQDTTQQDSDSTRIAKPDRALGRVDAVVRTIGIGHAFADTFAGCEPSRHITSPSQREARHGHTTVTPRSRHGHATIVSGRDPSVTRALHDLPPGGDRAIDRPRVAGHRHWSATGHPADRTRPPVAFFINVSCRIVEFPVHFSQSSYDSKMLQFSCKLSCSARTEI